MSPFKPSLIMMALGVAGMSYNLAAAEQQTSPAADENIEIIEVSGIRGSMRATQAVKMSSNEIVESINAEEIGKLPDLSIAESLARLPGLAAQRLDGRANVVSIRGLAPDFTTATLNGREQVTVGDNRGVEFDQYPSELINSVVVYKTPNAALLAQAIGGTVDMRTVKPLSFSDRIFAVNARGEYNDLGKLNPDGEDKGYRASFSYIDQFMDDTVGVAIGYAKLFSPNQEERWQAWGYPELDYNPDNPLVLGGAKPFVRSSLLERDGVMVVIEYQPNDKFSATLDAYYTKFSDEQLLRGIEIPGQWGAGWANDGVVSQQESNGLVTEGIFTNSKVLVRNDVNRRDADTYALGWNGNYVVNDDWSVDLDLSYSQADRTDFGLETYSGTSRGNGCIPGGCEDLRFEMQGDRGAMFYPSINYADPALVKLGGPFSWGNNVTVPGNAQDGFINTPSIKDELSAVRMSAERLLAQGPINAVEFGVNYSNRKKSKADEGYFLTLKDYPNTLAVPSEFLLNPTSLDFIGMGNMLTYDAEGLYNSGIYQLTSEGETVASRATNTWSVEEDVTTGYVMASVDTELADKPLLGNFGVQVVHTKQHSTGKAVTQDANGLVSLQDNEGGTTYTEWLPSVNLSWHVIDNQQLRFAAARSLSRARMDKMNASLTFNFDPSLAGSTDINNSPWSGGGGNPELKPWMAWQYDLGYEIYLDEGYLAFGAFYKDLENYVFDESVTYDFGGFLVPDPQPSLQQGLYTTPQNGRGGYIRGLEFSAHLTGAMLADSLSGFGIILSGAYNDSEVQEGPDSDPIDLPGLSKKVGNATFYYEDYGFQARISARYRSDFLGEVTGRSLERTSVYVKAETLVDAQLGYDLTEFGVDGFSVLLQVNNLTDEPFVTYQNGDSRQIRDYQQYGRNYMLGVNYTF
ncbi:TonB-dependent receptor [Shewanella sp. NIFS-20-20]|uniref:TonB-dependent receptor n=1 Tax=Shewanella sp. NIFS-20-20 TaxID=2853806 RepID=UPI001C4884CA|nr:TonB-dependent receptor [Shewanella sp. NIFS-20-20]MBV7315277.1 TonB-dependent receptor [Shewanella sp. NIFS-20-20]